MTRRQDFDDQLRAWAELGDERLPARYLDAALAQIETTPQRRSLAGWRFPPMNRFAPLALAATALVVVLLIGIGLILRSPNVGPSPIPGPTHSATLEPSATAEPIQRAAAWSATASMIEARNDFTATRLADGRVLVAGGDRGFEAVPRALASAEVYDPVRGTWTATGSMLTGRYRHSATLLPDGRVLVAGGNIGGSQTLGVLCCLASAELYDPSTGTWSSTGSMVERRVDFNATLLLDGRVLVAGGDSYPLNGTTPGAELYDRITGSWTATQAMTWSNYENQAALLADGKVLLVGGVNRNTAMQLFDPSNGSWSALDCPLGVQQEGCDVAWRTATRLPDGSVLVTNENRAALYDPRAGTWRPTGSLVAHNHLTGLLLLDGTVLLLDRTDVGDTAQLYDPKSGTWTAAARPIAARYGAEATLLLDGRVLLVGGYANTPDAPLPLAELYDPGSGN